MYQWEDGTVAYFSRYRRFQRQPPSCAAMTRSNMLMVYFCSSTLSYPSHVLCERDEPPLKAQTSDKVIQRRRRGLATFKGRGISVPVVHVVCPSGHWTHAFLACDVQSACWQQDKLSESNIKSRMASPCLSNLLTLFTCRNGVGHVPYSLVCDHSEDCLDTSDEDFCVHPPCSGSWQFECTNGQVGSN